MRVTSLRWVALVAFVGAIGGVAFWVLGDRDGQSRREVAASRPAVASAGANEPSRQRALGPVQPADPVATLHRAWRSGTAGERERATRELLPGILARNPTAVGALLDWPDSGLGRENLLQEIARTWARIDLPAAAAWLLTLADSDAAIAEDAVLAEVGRDDAAGALGLAHALRRGVDDGRAEHIAQIWLEEDATAAVAWISGLAPGADRDRLLARAALVRVRQDPAESVRLLSAMTDGSARETAVAATIARLRIYDPQKADSWQSIVSKN